MSDTVASAKSRLGGYSKHRKPGDPAIVEAAQALRDALAEEKIRRAIAALVTDAPPVAEAVITLVRSARRASTEAGHD